MQIAEGPTGILAFPPAAVRSQIILMVVSKEVTWTLRNGLYFGSSRLIPQILVPSSLQSTSLKSGTSSSLPLNVLTVQLVRLAFLLWLGMKALILVPKFPPGPWTGEMKLCSAYELSRSSSLCALYRNTNPNVFNVFIEQCNQGVALHSSIVACHRLRLMKDLPVFWVRPQECWALNWVRTDGRSSCSDFSPTSL